MAAFKDEFSAGLVEALGRELRDAWPPFPLDRFVAEATDGLDARELKGRVALIGAALATTLPPDPGALEELVGRASGSPAFRGWMLWPFLDAVTERTLHDPDRGLPLLRALTSRASAEFAIRPFLRAHPATTFAHLAEWAGDPDEHVRRLVSEGTRPRLPWASRLTALVADPSPSLPLLHRLRDDPSEYVRRSVANHLNDIAKDHPDLAVAIAGSWVAGGGAHVERVVRHGLRGLLKAGHPGALAAVGVRVDDPIDVLAFSADPAALPIGGSVSVTCTIVTPGPREARAEIDLRVHYANAAGALTRRATFRFARRALSPGTPETITRSIAFRPVSIRALHPGRHLLELQVNGSIVADLAIDLTP